MIKLKKMKKNSLRMGEFVDEVEIISNILKTKFHQKYTYYLDEVSTTGSSSSTSVYYTWDSIS